MKKGTKLVALLLGLALMVPACTPGTNPSKSSEEPGTSSEAPVNYKVTISNKQELQAEWFVGDPSRKVNLEVEPKANITQLVNEGKITITSSDPAKLAVEGQMASPVAAGEATITVKCGESEDTVKVTLQAKQTVKEKYGVNHEGTAEDPFDNEDACKVAKHEKYNNEDFYVKGKVSSFYYAPGSRTSGEVAFYLTPAEGKTEKFEVFKCFKDKEQKQPLTDDDIWVGGEVTAHGPFTVYNNTQAETSSAIFVKCEGTKPQPRQTLTKTFAEVLAVGNALQDSDSTWDYYKFQGYVTEMEGDNFFLTATKGEALVPGKSDAAHQEKDIKGTNAIELYNAGKNADVKAKLTKNAKIEVTMIVKNYHGTIENGLDLKNEDVTVLEAGEPWVINYENKTTAEALTIINALEDGKTAEGYYAVSGVVVAVTTAYSTKYGNISFTMGDAATDTNLLTVFRLTTDADTAAKIVAGAEVVVKGQLQKYVKDGAMTPELINAKEIEIKDGGEGGGEGGDTVDPATVKTVTLNIGEYATAQSITNGTKVSSIALDSVVTAKAEGTDSNTGKIYIGNTGTTEWRFYKSGAGTLKIELAAGYILVSAKAGIAKSNYGDPTDTDLTVADNKASYTDTASNFNVKTIEVKYGQSASGGDTPVAPVKAWDAAEIKTAIAGGTATEVTGKYAADSEETFTAYKIGTAGMTITLNVNSAAAQHVKLQLKMATKFSNLSKCGIWWQLPNGKSGLENVVQKTEVKLGETALPVPEEKSLEYTNLASYNPVQSPDAKDGGSALSAPVWVNMLELDLAAGDNTITVKYLDGGYSYWIAGAQLVK